MSGHEDDATRAPAWQPRDVPDPLTPHAALLAREAASLVARLRLFTPARWAAEALPHGTRGDLVHHLAASLVVAAGETRERLPRLDDLGLADQLAVTADDLVRVGPATSVALDQVAHLLLHRRELLDEVVPSGLLADLGEESELTLLRRARHVCGA